MSALFVNHLTVLDFSYVHPDRGILGESWIVDVILHGELDSQGMVFDFGDVKKQVRQAVEDLFDHKLVIPTQGLHGYKAHQQVGQLKLQWLDSQQRRYEHLSPADSVLTVDANAVTPAIMTPLLEAAALAAVPGNVGRVQIQLRTEAISGAFYHYSHGLKKHRGNCQRIAHGHRSRLHILRNGKRDSLLEKAWAMKWRDIYIATQDDIKTTFEHDNVSYITVGYAAEQGEFELTLPRSKTYVIATDSTVELLADHMACALKQDAPDQHFEVRAFEGVMKGAIALK